MSPPTLTRKANAFAKLVRQPGGLSMDEAVRAADENLRSIRGQLVAEVEAAVERMQALGGALRDGPDQGALNELYRSANSVIGLAGPSGLPATGQVCYSLCELIDRLQTSDTWNAPALQVHMDSLRLLRSGAAEDEAQQEAIVAALRRVVARVLPPGAIPLRRGQPPSIGSCTRGGDVRREPWRPRAGPPPCSARAWRCCARSGIGRSRRHGRAHRPPSPAIRPAMEKRMARHQCRRRATQRCRAPHRPAKPRIPDARPASPPCPVRRALGGAGMVLPW